VCVPGGSFTLGGTVTAPTSQATVADFHLDKYEVSVGRFNAFVASYDAWRAAGNPRQGAAAHPLIAESGWRVSWTALLPSNSSILNSSVRCGTYATGSAGRAQLPMNCVSWYEAFAFCAWDGGRLPTEVEWEYAAAAGSEGRLYPWGADPPTADRAVYDCLANDTPGCRFEEILVVGSKPSGVARWAQHDLAGSMWEWVVDSRASYPPVAVNYANVSDGSTRVVRGGSWFNEAADMRAANRLDIEPTTRNGDMGIRCAR